jgi:phosphopentomutase
MRRSSASRDSRAILLVLDSAGCGAADDAAAYGDGDSDTLGNTARCAGGLNLPVLARLGLGSIHSITGVAPAREPLASWGKARERGVQKDTVAGHWELAGYPLMHAFPTYPDGFPLSLMDRFTQLVGLGWLGNKAASGTAIIEELGDAHRRTGSPIIYTSADSVFQIAAHEEVIPIERLYEIGELCRTQLLVGQHAVGRVILRPFVGKPGSFCRTDRRRDLALAPMGPTLIDQLLQVGVVTHGVGKIGDIFAWRSIADSVHVTNNDDAMAKLRATISAPEQGVRVSVGIDAHAPFVFANFNDFDMLWGHRNNWAGYAAGLEAVDAWLPSLFDELIEGDLLIITADHGCDPTDISTDHTREFIPVLACPVGRGGGRAFLAGEQPRGNPLGIRSTFADIGQTIAEYYGLIPLDEGVSFLQSILP